MASVTFWIVRRQTDQETDMSGPLALLRARCKRPRGCRTADQGDELAALHFYHLVGAGIADE